MQVRGASSVVVSPFILYLRWHSRQAERALTVVSHTAPGADLTYRNRCLERLIPSNRCRTHMPSQPVIFTGTLADHYASSLNVATLIWSNHRLCSHTLQSESQSRQSIHPSRHPPRSVRSHHDQLHAPASINVTTDHIHPLRHYHPLA